MYEADNSVDTNGRLSSLLFRRARGIAMYWWQWVLQIIGGWFCLGIAVGALWIAFVRLGRRSKVRRPAAWSALGGAQLLVQSPHRDNLHEIPVRGDI
jgi:hypothetical protein